MALSLAEQSLTRFGSSTVSYLSSSRRISNVTVIGAGLMGSGIAQVAAQTGHVVVLSDISDDLLKKSAGNIQKSLERIAKKQFASNPEEGTQFVASTLKRLSLQSNVEEAVKNADLIVEAIIENVPIKHKLYTTIDKIAPASAIFASNTSSLSITELASVTNRKDKFGGLHFFNPVPLMKLVEVIRSNDTSDETFNKLIELGKKMGKTTVSCKDTPGFIVNRLLVPYTLEALRLVERGEATNKDVDVAMKLGAGYSIGPFELGDYVGLDTLKFIIDGWHQKFPENSMFSTSPLLDKLVADGKLGRKTGEGFYKY